MKDHTHLSYGQNPKSPTNLLQQHDTHYKTRCHMAPLQNLLLHDTHYKACCYTSPFTKFVATQHPLQSLLVTRHALQSLLLHNTLYKTYWYTTPYKAQKKHLAIFIEAHVCTWQYFIKSQNIILATFYKKTQYYFGNISSKTQNY